MALAGVDYDELARRIDASGYGARTLRRIADPSDTGRPWRKPDLAVIGEACGVSAAFWTVDFSQLGIPNHVGLVERVEALENELATVYRIVTGRVARSIADTATGAEQPEGLGDPGDESGRDRPD